MVQVPRSLGVFRAVVTRDGEALSRSGEAFYQCRNLPETAPAGDVGRLYEVLFADGAWMLAREEDLEFSDG